MKIQLRALYSARGRFALTGILAALALVTAAHAAPQTLPDVNGDSVAPTVGGSPASLDVVATVAGTFSTGGGTGLNGTYTEYVVQSSTLPTYSFYFQFALNTLQPGNNATNGAALSQVFLGSFGSIYTLQVFADTGGETATGGIISTLPTVASGIVPTTVEYDSVSGGGLNVNLPSTTTAGTTTDWIVITTNANSLLQSTASAQDGTSADLVATSSSGADALTVFNTPNGLSIITPGGQAVPEPTTALFGFALLGGVVVARRRQTQTPALSEA